MKIREQIIEAFFRARNDLGHFQPVTGIGYMLKSGRGEELANRHPLDKDFDLFREHVIEVMAERGYVGRIMGVLSFEYEVFIWVSRGAIQAPKERGGEAEITDNQWLLAAIEAATLVLEGEKEKPE